MSTVEVHGQTENRDSGDIDLEIEELESRVAMLITVESCASATCCCPQHLEC